MLNLGQISWSRTMFLSLEWSQTGTRRRIYIYFLFLPRLSLFCLFIDSYREIGRKKRLDSIYSIICARKFWDRMKYIFSLICNLERIRRRIYFEFSSPHLFFSPFIDSRRRDRSKKAIPFYSMMEESFGVEWKLFFVSTGLIVTEVREGHECNFA